MHDNVVTLHGQTEALPDGWSTRNGIRYERWIPEGDFLIVDEGSDGMFYVDLWFDDPSGAWSEDAGPVGKWVTLSYATLAEACAAIERNYCNCHVRST